MREIDFPLGLTFDDVLLFPSKSDILPSEVDVTTNFTPNITLNIPIVSAAMDTVTDANLAIAIAREGGIGVIHRNMHPEKQAMEVDKVKKSESGMIIDPITISPNAPISEVIALMERYRISGFPVTVNGKLVGIITNRDLKFERDLTRKVEEVMTKERLITAQVGITLEEAEEILHRYKIEKLPIVDKDFNLKGLITIKDIEKRKKYPNACKDYLGRLRVAAAVGVGESAILRTELLIKAGVDAIVIDTAHGHSKGVIQTLKELKSRFDIDVVVGNIATKEAAQELIEGGADAVKVGIGPGSICTTRIVAGAGVPQLTAIMNCASVASKYNIPVIADGGIKYSGDITKALAAGAHCVMIGSLFAGTDEAPGEIILYQGRSYKTYRGMGSIEAMESWARDRYRQEIVSPDKLVPEGVEGRVPYRRPLAKSIYQLVGCLKSGIGYCCCRTLEELRTKTKFIKITNAGLRESHVHDVTITKESPNYWVED